MANNKKEVKMPIKATTISWCIAAIGAALILVTAIDWGTEISTWVQFLLTAAECLGTTLLSVGLVSLLVEISTINEIVDKAMKHVLDGDVPVDHYSRSHLTKLKDRMAAQLAEVTETRLKKSAYSLEPHLLELTKGLYYEYHNMSCEIYPKDSSGLFTKKMKIEYKIINHYEIPNCIRLGLSLYDLEENMTDEQRLAGVKIKTFMVNGTDLRADPLVTKRIQHLDVDGLYEYDYTYLLERPLQTCREHIVKLEYEYDTRQSDLTQTWKLVYPCKKTQHTITIKGTNEWALKATAFAAFYHMKSTIKDSFKVEQSLDKHTKIEFDEWAVPGAGYVVSYNKIS